MGKQTLNNLVPYLEQRNKINANFDELYQNSSLERVIVRSIDDFPADVAGVITLENKTYKFDLPMGTTIETALRFEVPVGGIVKFIADEPINVLFKYTGVGTMFTGADIQFVSFFNINVSSPNGSLFDITSSSPTSGLFMSNSVILDCAALGSAAGVDTLSIQYSGMRNFGQGLSMSDINTFSCHLVQQSSTIDSGGTMFLFNSGTFNEVSISHLFSNPLPTEHMLYIDPLTTINRMVVNGSTCNDIARVFAPGSLDQKEIDYYFFGNEGMPNSQKVASYFSNDNAIDTGTAAAGLGVWLKVAGVTTEGVALEKFDLPLDNRARFLNKNFIGKVGSSVSATTTNSSAKIYEFAYFKNGVLVPGSITKRTIKNEVGAILVQAVLEMTTNDYVELYVRQTLGPLADVTVTDFNPIVEEF